LVALGDSRNNELKQICQTNSFISLWLEQVYFRYQQCTSSHINTLSTKFKRDIFIRRVGQIIKDKFYSKKRLFLQGMGSGGGRPSGPSLSHVFSTIYEISSGVGTRKTKKQAGPVSRREGAGSWAFKTNNKFLLFVGKEMVRPDWSFIFPNRIFTKG
jgi:hypothetical protein